MTLDPAGFRNAMSRLPTGVTVVTVRDADGRAAGMTVSAVSSLSLNPPMLLICVDRQAEIHDLIVRAARFSVAVLERGRQDLAERFAERGRHLMEPPEPPASPAGLPLLDGVIAHFDCRRSDVFPGGDHSIVTGVVEWAATSDGEPLCHFRSRYAGIAP